MKRCKVILRRDPMAEGKCVCGLLSSIVDADTGEPLECAQDFNLNVPMDEVMTVDVRLLVHEIEVK